MLEQPSKAANSLKSGLISGPAASQGERQANLVAEVRVLLSEELATDNPVRLAEQLAACEAWQPTISLLYRQAEADLALAKNRFYDPSLPTVDQRKLAVESATREAEMLASTLCDIADIIKRRISLGQTLLKNHAQELSSGLR